MFFPFVYHSGFSSREVFPKMILLFVQQSLAFNPAMLRPGGPPPRKEPSSEKASFDEPPVAKTLEAVAKVIHTLMIKL